MILKVLLGVAFLLSIKILQGRVLFEKPEEKTYWLDFRTQVSYIQEDIINPGTLLGLSDTYILKIHPINSTAVPVSNLKKVYDLIWAKTSKSRPTSFYQFNDSILVVDSGAKCVLSVDRLTYNAAVHSGHCEPTSVSDGRIRDGSFISARYARPVDINGPGLRASLLYMTDKNSIRELNLFASQVSSYFTQHDIGLYFQRLLFNGPFIMVSSNIGITIMSAQASAHKTFQLPISSILDSHYNHLYFSRFNDTFLSFHSMFAVSPTQLLAVISLPFEGRQKKLVLLEPTGFGAKLICGNTHDSCMYSFCQGMAIFSEFITVINHTLYILPTLGQSFDLSTYDVSRMKYEFRFRTMKINDCRYAAQPETCRVDKSNFLVSGLGDSYEADSEEFQLKPLDKDQCQQFRNKAVHQSGQQATLEPHPTKVTLNKQTNFSDSNITMPQSSYVNASSPVLAESNSKMNNSAVEVRNGSEAHDFYYLSTAAVHTSKSTKTAPPARYPSSEKPQLVDFTQNIDLSLDPGSIAEKNQTDLSEVDTKLSRNSTDRIIAGVSATLVMALIVIFISLYIRYRKKQKHRNSQNMTKPDSQSQDIVTEAVSSQISSTENMKMRSEEQLHTLFIDPDGIYNEINDELYDVIADSSDEDDHTDYQNYHAGKYINTNDNLRSSIPDIPLEIASPVPGQNQHVRIQHDGVYVAGATTSENLETDDLCHDDIAYVHDATHVELKSDKTSL